MFGVKGIRMGIDDIRSPIYDDPPWVNGEIRADEAPTDENQNGIWAETSVHESFKFGCPLFLVEGWGAIAPYERGFRSECARIVALISDHIPACVRTLVDAHAIPTAGFHALTEHMIEYPELDTPIMIRKSANHRSVQVVYGTETDAVRLIRFDDMSFGIVAMITADCVLTNTPKTYIGYSEVKSATMHDISLARLMNSKIEEVTIIPDEERNPTLAIGECDIETLRIRGKLSVLRIRRSRIGRILTDGTIKYIRFVD